MENNYNHVLTNFMYVCLMCATPFLEHDNSSFSKLLLSKEVADIIKQAVRESTQVNHLGCNDGKNIKGKFDD